jgi:hypothetical protein
MVEGKPAADIWAARAGDRAWEGNTRGVLMSATKGIVAIAVARLVDRGATGILRVTQALFMWGKQDRSHDRRLDVLASLIVMETARVTTNGAVT